jgi:BlaI family transcriptional regulator, penicillinase repressor
MARPVPPPLELLCLRILWDMGESNAGSVRQALPNSKPLAYTTVTTLLDRLMGRGVVSRRKVGRAYVYRAEATREEMQRAAVASLVESLFDGSEMRLIQFVQSNSAGAAAPAAAEDLDTVLL